jgi:peptidoglycan/LPS O-acetylase OafA/YrhL
MSCQKEIDSLRAIAILPVILFHIDSSYLPGGFLGVDIFFVISGYLITTIILNDLTKERFSIVNFYERRARRMLPALFFMLFAVLGLTALLFSPAEFKEFGQSLVSVLLFISNIFFYREIDYFSLAAEEMPLLHTWSLSIEEQFYLFFSPFMMLLWRIQKQKLLIELADKQGVTHINSYNVLCFKKGCPAVLNNNILYFDDDHLSQGGAKVLISKLYLD